MFQFKRGQYSSIIDRRMTSKQGIIKEFSRQRLPLRGAVSVFAWQDF